MSTATLSEFVEFPKIARLSRECVITEKIDGTNGQILIVEPGVELPSGVVSVATVGGLTLFAGSRTRFIHPATGDNFGFAAWVRENAEELAQLGPGRHFGEWWGSGIQRGYNLQKGEKRFSLFNTSRWLESRPACCHVVPVLHQGLFSTEACGTALERLRTLGSEAAPGFMKPEGIVCFHVAANVGFKKTLEKDDVPKSRA